MGKSISPGKRDRHGDEASRRHELGSSESEDGRVSAGVLEVGNVKHPLMGHIEYSRSHNRMNFVITTPILKLQGSQAASLLSIKRQTKLY